MTAERVHKKPNRRIEHGATLYPYLWLRVVPEVPVPPVPGLDLPVPPPPPLASFVGCRSRTMASLMSFLSRRQTDRITLMFGLCVFMRKMAFWIAFDWFYNSVASAPIAIF